MTHVAHITPGLIDIRAFSVMGLNSKPNSNNAIGYFGTGLKYAIAVLIRHGLKVTVWIGEEPYVFYGQELRFRDKDFLQLRFRRRAGVTARWMSTELPFTTELGKNWELWMAYRELHSNTLDENGHTRPADAYEHGQSGYTKIVVEGEAYAEVHAKADEVFLPAPRLRLLGKSSNLEVYDQPSDFVYYRGLRVGRHPRPAAYTWNFTVSLGLTEDRTLTYPFMVNYYVAQYVMGLSDADFLRNLIKAKDESFEGELNYDEHRQGATVTPEFLEAVRMFGRSRTTVMIIREADERDQRKRAQSQGVAWHADLLTYLVQENEATWLAGLRRHRVALVEYLKTLSPPEKPAAPPWASDDMPF